MIKTALVFGGAYALGSLGGGKVADAVGATSDGARTGIKIGAGVVAFYVLSMVLR
jgi:hypothetical protein